MRDSRRLEVCFLEFGGVVEVPPADFRDAEARDPRTYRELNERGEVDIVGSCNNRRHIFSSVKRIVKVEELSNNVAGEFLVGVSALSAPETCFGRIDVA